MRAPEPNIGSSKNYEKRRFLRCFRVQNWLNPTASDKANYGLETIAAAVKAPIRKFFVDKADGIFRMAILSLESSDCPERVTIQPDWLRPIVLGKGKPRGRCEEELARHRKAIDWIYKPMPWDALVKIRVGALMQPRFVAFSHSQLRPKIRERRTDLD